MGGACNSKITGLGLHIHIRIESWRASMMNGGANWNPLNRLSGDNDASHAADRGCPRDQGLPDEWGCYCRLFPMIINQLSIAHLLTFQQLPVKCGGIQSGRKWEALLQRHCTMWHRFAAGQSEHHLFQCRRKRGGRLWGSILRRKSGEQTWRLWDGWRGEGRRGGTAGAIEKREMDEWR